MSAALLTLAVELRLRVDGCTCGLLWLTDVDPASPAFSASFTVPANASPDGLRARHADLRAAFVA